MIFQIFIKINQYLQTLESIGFQLDDNHRKNKKQIRIMETLSFKQQLFPIIYNLQFMLIQLKSIIQFLAVLTAASKHYQLTQQQLPTQLDWNHRGYVTDVYKISICRAGIIEATLSLAESTLLINKQFNKPDQVSLSAQYLYSCPYGNRICMSGELVFIEEAMEYIYTNGITEAGNDNCDSDHKIKINHPPVYYYDLTNQELMSLLQYGPVIVGVAVKEWQFTYIGGIMECQKSETNYAVLLVGYTEQYWICKNSQGESWGAEKGYIFISKKEGKNCGIGKYIFKFDTSACPPGCERCSLVKKEIRCIKCADPNSHLTRDGKCRCDDLQVFDKETMKCSFCKVPFCIQCQLRNDRVCRVCMQGYEFIEDYCRCKNTSLVPNFLGKCVECEDPGCLSCLQNDPSMCLKCLDLKAVIQQGKCECLGNYIKNENEGTCQFDGNCPIGCSECDSRMCTKCQNALMRIKDGQCRFSNQYYYDIDKHNNIEICNVVGCGLCEEDQTDLCSKCYDQNAFLLSDGTACVCPDGTIFNDAEKCVSLKRQIDGCMRVKQSNHSKCSQCKQGYTLVKDVCRFDDIQAISGCIFYERPINRCLQCIEGLELLSGGCICPIAGTNLNQNYQCKVCYAAHCKICQQNNPYKCFACEKGYSKADDRCFNATRCNVEGCRKCLDEDRNVCVQCIDRTAYILNGQCRCKENNDKIDSFGICAQQNDEIERFNFFDAKERTLPKIDWSRNGVATPAKDKLDRSDQNLDWVFSMAALIESHFILQQYHQTTIDISEEYILKCINRKISSSIFSITQYLGQIFQGGEESFAQQSEYPYNEESKNKFSQCAISAIVLKSNYIVTSKHYSTEMLQKVLQNGPFIVTFSQQFDPASYSAGQIISCSQQYIPSQMTGLVVGYTDEYWIVKYNLGISWGNQGRVFITKEQGKNCGIQNTGDRLYRKTKYRECEKIKGCLICSYDQSYCYLCVNDAIYNSDSRKCNCPAKKSLSPGGYCEDCKVYGCQTCDPYNSHECQTCETDFLIENKKCKCTQANKKINRFGVCTHCQIEGCEFCSPNNPSICEKCIDNFAVLKNGKCLCESDLYPYFMNSQGYCQLCLVDGCLKCQQDPYKCKECKSSFILNESKQCICEPSFYMDSVVNICRKCEQNYCLQCTQSGSCQLCQTGYLVNSLGQCKICNVNRCTTCFKPDKCSSCVDKPLSRVISNQCSCIKPLHRFNSDNFCTECRVPFCQICKARFQAQCSVCQNNMMVTDEGLCSCQDGQTLNSINRCQLCNSENCQKCADNKNDICEKCPSPEFYLFEGKCVRACIANSSEQHCQRNKIWIFILIGFGVVVVVVLMIVTGVICYRKKKKSKQYKDNSNSNHYISNDVHDKAQELSQNPILLPVVHGYLNQGDTVPYKPVLTNKQNSEPVPAKKRNDNDINNPKVEDIDPPASDSKMRPVSENQKKEKMGQQPVVPNTYKQSRINISQECINNDEQL